MRRSITGTGCLLLCLFICQLVSAQDFTNKGKDFWIGYGNHVRMFTVVPPSEACGGAGNNTCPEKMQVYITSDVSTTGTIEIPGVGFTRAFTVTANQITTVDIPRSAALVDEGIYNRGIHITSQLPVVVYSFIYVSAISGASLCLPTTVLGREYYSVNFTQLSNEANSYSYFFVVATEDNTTVEITPSQTTKGGKQANVPFTVLLNKGQIYQVLGALTSPTGGGDLTGSLIRSINAGTGCKKIAVFCGSGKISIGCTADAVSSDNLYQQIYPNNSWGKKYITTPSTNNSSNFQTNFYRIIRPDATTTVKLNGAVITAPFTNNFYYQFSNNSTNVIEADKPILVAQYFTTSASGGGGGNNANCGNSGIGDPDMIYINPIEQTIQHVTLNSMQPSSNTAITTHFINVVLKNHPSVISSFKIDGTSYSSRFSAVSEDNAYAYARINVSSGTHNLVCDSGFNAIAYGFGNAESYGYSAGSNLRDLYQYVSIKNEYATVNFPAGCKNSPFKFAITLPYQPISLQWEFKGLFSDTAISFPVFDSTWVTNGRTLYRYTIDKEYAIPAIGTYPITIMANNPTADGCSGEQQIDYDLQIFERPSALADISFTGCFNDAAQFTDVSDGGGRSTILRFWDFGDGIKDNTSKDPTHLYTVAKDYTVKFAIINDVGCLSDTAKLPVTVNPLPIADFAAPAIKCAAQAVAFTDKSTIAAGSIEKWNWIMGDGTSSALQHPAHVYDVPGNYTVSLQVTSGKGCKSNIVTSPAPVSYVPKAAFKTPEICLNDAFAQFTDISTIGDNTEAQFTYLWNFGDVNASAGNLNTSSVRGGQHKYFQAANFNVKLTVTSKNGCAADTTIIFTVNGSIPRSDFSVNNAAALCSNLPVSITDRSTVDFGNITRVEVYWDYVNDPLNKTADEEPTKGSVYTHTYADFGIPATKELQIKYVVYSGITCVNESQTTVTLNGSPQLTFSEPPPVCNEAASFMITQAQETAALAGTGIYSGTAISSGGSFNPGLATPGLNTITYKFTTNAGCTASLGQTILVYPTPVVHAGGNKYFLEGVDAIIPATASGNNLTYAWSPAIYMKNPAVLTPEISPVEDITYTIKVTSADGCSASDAMHVTVLKAIKVPNAFSPNGDGINDTWQIPALAAYPGAEITVFDRYGQKVYQSYEYSKPWDGKQNGHPLPYGTYYWIIKAKNGRPPVNGSVTIIY